MREQVCQAIEEVSELFSWYRQIGIKHLDISEESIKVISRWTEKRKINTPVYQQLSHTVVAKAKPIDVITKVDEITFSSIKCEGDLNSQLFFFSESFSYTEPIGELFINILKAMNHKKESICLCTFPPLDYRLSIPVLRQQVNFTRKQVEDCIDEIKAKTNGFYPQIICTLGDSALKIMMGREYMLSSSRGRFHNYNGTRLMPTYHPANIIDDKNLKRLVWEDMKQVMGIIGSV
ncbi:MAG: hypothetical protein HQK64_02540 [Desulfamplus sp.]|nr:hypothetical protein [Desulfamplus sp.]MBF0389327.1 hypothetical protein [Desulfamplus sp.]